MFDFCGLFFARLDGGRKILVLFIRVHSRLFAVQSNALGAGA
jgi:hypothetical protein